MLVHQHPAEQDPAKDRDIGPGLDQSGPAEHFMRLEMLGQDGVFDRPEKGRMNPHRGQHDQQQGHVLERQTERADKHDEDLGGLHDPHEVRLVGRIGELPGERRQQEEGQDEQSTRDRAEGRLLRGVAVDAVNHQHDHRGAEQIVVERAEELGREQGQETATQQQAGRRFHRVSLSCLVRARKL